MPHDRILALEGLDGAGKTTTAKLLVELINGSGRKVTYLRAPGSTALGEVLRDVLLNRKDINLDPEQMTLLFGAEARAVMLHAMALEAQGHIVILDRCFISNMAYRFADGMNFDELNAFAARWVPGLPAGRIAFLYVDEEDRRDRMSKAAADGTGRGLDRFESKPQEYFTKVADGYQMALDRGFMTLIRCDGRRPLALAQALAKQFLNLDL